MTAVAFPGGGAHPQRPGEIVELSELLYRGIFGSGMLVAAFTAALGIMLSAFQPPAYRLSGALACAALLVGCVVALALRAQAYGTLRQHPWTALAPALAVGGAAVAAGRENQQLFYVITLVMGVTGLAVPLSWLLAGMLVAVVGVQLPWLLAGTFALSSTAVAAITVPTVFWLIIERLARYMLRMNELTAPTSPAPRAVRSGARRGDDGNSRNAGRTGGRWLPAPRRRRALTTATGLETVRGRSPLSARQLQVVLLCAEGLNHLQIAACLKVGPQQVRRHLRHARESTGSRTTAELVGWALRAGLIPNQSA